VGTVQQPIGDAFVLRERARNAPFISACDPIIARRRQRQTRIDHREIAAVSQLRARSFAAR
jgi:hypothetical protein